jgi:hypothetical protein
VQHETLTYCRSQYTPSLQGAPLLICNKDNLLILPLVTKCYRCKIVGLTKTKQHLLTSLEQDTLAALSQEYDNLQHYLRTREDLGLYSANKQQADRFYKKIKKRQYPISVRSDLEGREKSKHRIRILGKDTSQNSQRWCMGWDKAVRAPAYERQNMRIKAVQTRQ